nr:immunoglobulin heavy chain junction region [Macaca mulatta]
CARDASPGYSASLRFDDW